MRRFLRWLRWFWPWQPVVQEKKIDVDGIRSLPFQFDDGGRAAAGYSGWAGDCVVRAIAIGIGLPYQRVYDDLFQIARDIRDTKRCKLAKRYQSRKGACSPRNGVHRRVYAPYLKQHGWVWVPTMGRLRAGALPSGRVIVRIPRHLCSVVDGVLHDTEDLSKNGTERVFGYWTQR